MDGRDIKTARPVPQTMAEVPSPRAIAKQSSLVHVAFATSMGAYYSFPDMTQDHFQELIGQLDVDSEQIIARNISGATLVLPMRILSKLWMLQVEEDWKLHETSPQASMTELWSSR